MLNVTLAQKLKDLFFGQPGNPKSIKNANTNPPSDAEIIALLSSAGEPYKVITGLLTGDDTTPTFDVLQNESGVDISSISRTGAGDYDINVAGNVFTEDKTVVFITPQGSFLNSHAARKDANSVTIKLGLPAITDAGITVVDGQITDTGITVVDGQITDPLITDGSPPVINDPAIAGGTATMDNATIAGGTATMDDAAIAYAATDTGVVFVEIRIYN